MSEEWEGSITHSMSLGVFVIHLPRCQSRFRAISGLLEPLKLPVSWVDAVDGATLDLEGVHVHPKETKKFCGHQTLGIGTLACYLSHVKAWHSFQESKWDFALICEDDVHFNPDALRTVLRWVLQESDVWDVCSFQLNHRGFPLTVRRRQGRRLCYYLSNVTGAGAYVINRRAAGSLLKHAFPICKPVDHFYTQTSLLKLKFAGVEPRVVSQSQAFPSEIQKLGRENRSHQSLLLKLGSLLYRVMEDIKKGIYNLGKWFQAY